MLRARFANINLTRQTGQARIFRVSMIMQSISGINVLEILLQWLLIPHVDMGLKELNYVMQPCEASNICMPLVVRVVLHQACTDRG